MYLCSGFIVRLIYWHGPDFLRSGAAAAQVFELLIVATLNSAMGAYVGVIYWRQEETAMPIWLSQPEHSGDSVWPLT